MDMDMDMSRSMCCGFGIADEKIKIDGHNIRIAELRDIIAKHNRMASKGIKPFLSLSQELGIDQATLAKILAIPIVINQS